MIYLAPKYLILRHTPDPPHGPPLNPWHLATLTLHAEHAEIAAAEKWTGPTSPMLAWVPAISLGVAAWLGWLDTQTRKRGLRLTNYQDRVRTDLFREIVAQIGDKAKSAFAVGSAAPAKDSRWLSVDPETERHMAWLASRSEIEPWDGWKPPKLVDGEEAVAIEASR